MARLDETGNASAQVRGVAFRISFRGCMRTSARFYAFFAVALLAGAGCDQGTTPAPPTGPSAPASPAPVIPQGQIAVLSVLPESGATLVAEPCDGGYCIGERATNLRLTFNVQLDQEVREPWVTVFFYNGSQQCAGSGYPNVLQTIEPLRANTATTFTVSFLGLWTDPTGTLICRFPATTTRMVVQLLDVSDRRGRSWPTPMLLTREFAHSYTFVLP